MNRVSAETLARVKKWPDLVSVNLGILIVNSLFANAANMDADAGALERVVKTAPSSFKAPPVVDDFGVYSHRAELNAGIEMGLVSASIAAARPTTSPAEVFAIAAVSQAGSNIVDGGLAHTSLLDHAARKEPDVGLSSLDEALIAKTGFDWLDRIKDPAKRRLAKVGGATIGIGLTVGISFIDRKNFYPDLGSHLFGGVTGTTAHFIGRRTDESQLYAPKASSNDTATQTLAAVVEHG